MRSLWLTLPLLALLWPGCSDDAPLTAEQFLVEYPQAYCDYVWRCCSSDERSYNAKGVCTTAKTKQVEELLAFRAAENPGATFDHAAARSCLDVLNGNDCAAATKAKDCLLDVARPQHDDGEDCTYAVECTSYHCVQPQKNTPGTCGAASGSCSGDDRACGAGSYCDATRQCQPKKEVGNPCGAPVECLSGICALEITSCVTAPDPLCDGA
jgi:hypothetical protein